ncbi:MAG: hypothetical protein KJN71_04235 [Acidimicrobiia bacterium]|nr:hypothetical protein [Acidimicrobiia bacterium]
MAQRSQEGQFGIRTQAAKGTYDDPGALDSGVFYDILGGSLTPQREFIVADPEIGGTRDTTAAALTTVVSQGDVESYGYLNALATLLGGCLGDSSTSDDTNHYTHTITQLDSGELPWLSIEEGVGQDFETFNHTDARVNTMNLSAEPNGYLMMTAGLAAITTTAGNTRTDLTMSPGSTNLDASPLIVGPEIVITYDSASVCAKSFSLDINNNMELDDFCMGDIEVDTFTPKQREVTSGLSIRPDTSALWREAVFGAAGATAAVSGGVDINDLVITMTSTSLVQRGDNLAPYKVVVTIPSAFVEPFEVSPSGDDVIETDFVIRALRPSAGTDLITVAIDTGQDAVR